MPRTPVELRLWNSRTSSAAKRIALPVRVASSTSSPSSSSATPISRSSASSPSNFIAILPFDGTLVNASMLLRRTDPLAVANITCSLPQSASSSGSGRTVEIVSPCSSGSRLIIGRPRVAGPPSGRRHTFMRYTRPSVEKNSTGVCVEVTNSLVTTSSSLVAIALRPLPPRACARNASSGVRLM